MGVIKERNFLNANAGGKYDRAKDGEKAATASEARSEFKSFCYDALQRSNLSWKDDSHFGCSNWLLTDGRTLASYMWAHFRCQKNDGACVIAISMEKFPDGAYKLYAKFEIYTNKLPVGEDVRKKVYATFNEVALRENPDAEDIQFIVYHNDKIVDDSDEWQTDYGTAKKRLESSGDQFKRVCPSILIADEKEMDTGDVDELCRRAVSAIDELGEYYKAYYEVAPTLEVNQGVTSSETAPKDKQAEAKNIILYGPPGTGKTYTTVLKALEIIDGKPGEYEDIPYSDYLSMALPLYDRLVGDGRIKFVTFHQSYGYEEFIEGIRPSTDVNGNISYDVKDGVFKKFCDSARGKKDKNGNDLPYVFIIDEINRGNISKIFGELITLIEDNKREGEKEAAKALLPYPKKDENGKETEDYFSVPRNVYIIGTMNTADRSITSLDTALRRRFCFKEMPPRAYLLENSDGDDITVADKGQVINVTGMFRVMNERIEVLYDREHCLGHAYFMSLKDRPDIETLSEIFEKKVIPLLQEYFYDDYRKIRMVLGDDREGTDEGKQFIKILPVRKNLFESGAGVVDTAVYAINKEAFKNAGAYIKIYSGVGKDDQS